MPINPTQIRFKHRHNAKYLLIDFMAVPDSINSHTVGAHRIGHEVDFRELCLQGKLHKIMRNTKQKDSMFDINMTSSFCSKATIETNG